MKTSDGKRPYEWDFDGSCAPPEGLEHSTIYPWATTFSLGCFQWIPRANGKGLKRSKVAYRVSGLCSQSVTVYAKARAYCDRCNQLIVPFGPEVKP